MHNVSAMLVLVVVFALIFDYINGFHDTANAIATVVSTRVLSPLTAILLAASLNFIGGLVATRVAKTIATDVVFPHFASETLVLAAVIGGIVWNLITWKYGIPSSSSHALIGGLVGAGIAHGSLQAIKWQGVLDKVVIPLVISPVAGFVVGFILMKTITLAVAHSQPRATGRVFHWAQIGSSALMAYSHGVNDAQKSMGIITLALLSAGQIAKPEVPTWVVLSCATVMALGTSAGGWRIMRTMGHKIIRLQPVNGFAAEASGAAVILTASHFGMPVSTTHCIAGSIFGVGASKRLSGVRWQVAQNMIAAWLTTIPATAAVSAVAYLLLHWAGL